MASIGAKVVVAASNAARSLGQSLDKMGAAMEVAKYTERLVPSTRFVAVDGLAPTVNEAAAFIAPSANVVGDVSIGSHSSVWYGATIRGDGKKVSIGNYTSIGDRSLVHIAKIQSDNGTAIGDHVTIGSGAIIHAATVGDYSHIGPSAQVLDGSKVGKHCILAPGSVLGMNKEIPDGELWSGSPAKKVRALTKEELEFVQESPGDILELALLHAEECGKDYEQVKKDDEDYQDSVERDPDYFQPSDDDRNEGSVLGQGQPGRIFDTTLSHPEKAAKQQA